MGEQYGELGVSVSSDELFELVQGKNPHRYICDYVIFYLIDGILYIFICELKSLDTKRSHSQIIAGYHLIEFFINVLKRCGKLNIKVLISSEFEWMSYPVQ